MNNYQIITPKFGDIHYATLKQEGHLQGGTRPVIIAQNNKGNQYSELVEVLPFTSKMTKYRNQPTHVIIFASPENGLSRDSIVLAEQPRLIQKSEVGERIGSLTHQEQVEVGKARMVQTPFPFQ